MTGRQANINRVQTLSRHPTVVALIPGLLALGVGIWQLSIRGVFNGVTEFDDGVYLGSALRLVSGALPYRDFVFVQPPGITLLMAPIALIGRAVGTEVALELARVVTALVTAVNAFLIALLVRRRGRVAMLASGTALALFPVAVTADHTLKLEPYLVLFVLLGSLVVFKVPKPSLPRLFWAGVLFGIAGSIKLWAVFPLVALLASFVPRWRRVASLCVGAAVGFAVLCAPFVIGAPRSFAHEVFADQLFRSASVLNHFSAGQRLEMITGLLGLTSLPSSPALAIVLIVALVLALAAVYAVEYRTLSRLDLYLVLAAIASVLPLVEASGFYGYYAYFSAPFLAALFGVAIAGITRAVNGVVAIRARHFSEVKLFRTFTWLCAAALAVALLGEGTRFANAYLPHSDPSDLYGIAEPARLVDSNVPLGSCVVYDSPVLAIDADRFFSTAPDCPDIVDPDGLWLAYDKARTPPDPPPYPAVLVAMWRSYFERAQFALLSLPEPELIPFDKNLRRWFLEHYKLIVYQPGIFVYRHIEGTSR